MGHVGGKLAADPLRLFQLGDVGDEDGGTHRLALVLPPGHRGDEHPQGAGALGQGVHVQHHAGVLLLALLDGLPQAAAAGEQQGPIVLLPLGEAEDGPCRPVDGQHLAVLVQQDQALGHAVQNEGHLVPLVGDGLDVAPQPLHQLVDVAQDGPQLVVGLVFLQPRLAGAVQHPLESLADGVEGGHHPVGGAAGQQQGQQQSRRRGNEHAPQAAHHQAVNGGQGHGGPAHHAVGESLGHVEHGGAHGVGVAHRLSPAGGGGRLHLRPVSVVLQPLRVGPGVGQHGAVGVDDGQPLARRGLAELPGQLLGIGVGALGVHQHQQLLEGVPGGVHLPAAEDQHPHQVG